MYKTNTIHHISTHHPVHRSLAFRLRFLPRQTTSLRLQVLLTTSTSDNTSNSSLQFSLAHTHFIFFSFFSGSESFRRPTCDDNVNANPNEATLPPDRRSFLYQVLLLNCKFHWFMWSLMMFCGFRHTHSNIHIIKLSLIIDYIYGRFV
jgi:hypothetical protein